MKRPKSIISLLLVLCLLLQPFAPVFAIATTQGSGDISSAIEQFNETYDKIMAMNPIDLGLLGTGAVGVVGFFKGEDYVGEVEKANAEIEKAKAKAQEMKANFDKANVGSVKSMDVDKLAGTLTSQVKASAENQKVLNDCGESLVKVGEVLDTLGTVLGILNPILEVVGSICSVPPMTPVGIVAEGILLVTRPLAVAVPIVGATIKGAGEGLIASAQQAAAADEALLTMGEKSEPINVSKRVAKEMAKDGGAATLTSFIGSEACGNLVSKGAGKFATTAAGQKLLSCSAVNKHLGNNADDFAKGIKKVWGWSSDDFASNARKTALEDTFTKYLPSAMTEENVNRLFKNTNKIAGKLESKLYKEAVGESKTSFSTKGLAKDVAKTLYNNTVDATFDVGQPEEAGLNVGGAAIE